MRVLAFAYRPLEDLPDEPSPATVERDLVFSGLMAMIDPPREEVKAAVAECKRAGIRTVMITGDHKNTAVAIARELGFLAEDSIALTGEDLDGWADDKLEAEIRRIPVYARVSPEHKLRIVRAWRRRGDVVAMTGDGVNDAPAVKEADIGVAMGITGTDVTKEVSDMVVTDDNFASIVAAVEEGRGIYDNIKKFVHYLLSCNAGEILTMFTASLVGLPVPLLPIQILWVNLVTDGLPALALGVDPVDPGIMDKPPRDPAEPVVTRPRAFLMLAQGAFIAVCSLLAFVRHPVHREGRRRPRADGCVHRPVLRPALPRLQLPEHDPVPVPDRPLLEHEARLCRRRLLRPPGHRHQRSRPEGDLQGRTVEPLRLGPRPRHLLVPALGDGGRQGPQPQVPVLFGLTPGGEGRGRAPAGTPNPEQRRRPRRCTPNC